MKQAGSDLGVFFFGSINFLSLRTSALGNGEYIKFEMEWQFV